MSSEMVLHQPPVLGATWLQAGILVSDGSASMNDEIEVQGREGSFRGSKAAAVATAVSGLLDRMRASRTKSNFGFAEVTFTETTTGCWGPTAVADIDSFADFTPTRNGTGGTVIAAGLEQAHGLAREFLAKDTDGLPKSVVVLLLTDGECSQPDRTRAAAAALTSDPRITLACAYFATAGQPPVGLPLLQSICTAPASTWCRTVYDPETLREFFHRSLTNPASVPATTSR